jgi:hypothetical protein
MHNANKALKIQIKSNLKWSKTLWGGFNLLKTLLTKEEQKELIEEEQKAWNKKDLHKKKNS